MKEDELSQPDNVQESLGQLQELQTTQMEALYHERIQHLHSIFGATSSQQPGSQDALDTTWDMLSTCTIC